MPLLGASALLAGGLGASILFTGGTADAAACPAAPGTVGTGVICTIPATLTLTSGTLNLLAPPAVGWGTTITGADQVLSDPTAVDETYTVNDATGTAPGWNVTASATAFTATGGAILGTAGSGIPTFSTDGSLALTTGATPAIPATAPHAACAVGSTCTLPTNVGVTGLVAYPVTITTANLASTAPVSIYNADLGTGLGTIVIGGAATANPVGWWLNVPSNTAQGTYTSTVSLELNSGP